MKQTFKILEEISGVSGTNKKMELLSTLKDNEFAKFYFETVFNSYLTYGVSELGVCDVDYEVKSLKELKALRDKLVSRELTGGLARAELATTISTKDELVNKWLKMMWEKGIKIGISTISINKVFKDLIPKFELQQCQSLEEDEELTGNWIVQPKYDGLRAVIIFEGGRCMSILSRSGRELFNVDHIIKELTDVNFKNGVLDGELYGKDWNESISVVRASKGKRDGGAIKFYAFDYIPLNEWKSLKGTTPLVKRLEMLKNLINLPGGLVNIEQAPSQPVANAKEAWIWADKFKGVGYEGAVAKDLGSVYEFKRSENWLKLKFEESHDLEIIGYQEGSGKNKGRLGAFICKGFKGETINVGGGLSDEQREEVWKKKETYIGKIIEVKCQEKTKDGSMRFPVLVRFRDDKEVGK